MLALALTLLAFPPDGEAVRQAIIVKCGIGNDRLAVEHWSDPPEDALILKGDAPLSDAQLDCMGHVIADQGMIPFAFEDEAIRKRYSRLSGRSNLAAMGLLDRLPVFDRRRDTLRSFAHRLEQFCGARRGSLLVVEDGNIRVRHDAFNGPPSARKDSALCAVAALGASGFEAFYVKPIPMPDVTLAVSGVTTP